MPRSHDDRCRCAPCRHRRFNPGPATSSRRVTFYGHFPRSRAVQRRRLDLAVASHLAASTTEKLTLPKALARLAGLFRSRHHAA